MEESGVVLAHQTKFYQGVQMSGLFKALPPILSYNFSGECLVGFDCLRYLRIPVLVRSVEKPCWSNPPYTKIGPPPTLAPRLL